MCANALLLDGMDLPVPFDQENTGEQIRIALRPSPWADDRYLLIIENPTELPFHLHHLGWWDAGMRSDWLVAQATASGSWLQVQIERAGSYNHFWQEGLKPTLIPAAAPCLASE